MCFPFRSRRRSSFRACGASGKRRTSGAPFGRAIPIAIPCGRQEWRDWRGRSWFSRKKCRGNGPEPPKRLDDSKQPGQDKKNTQHPYKFRVALLFPVLPEISGGIAGQCLERNGIPGVPPMQDLVRLPAQMPSQAQAGERHNHHGNRLHHSLSLPPQPRQGGSCRVLAFVARFRTGPREGQEAESRGGGQPIRCLALFPGDARRSWRTECHGPARVRRAAGEGKTKMTRCRSSGGRFGRRGGISRPG